MKSKKCERSRRDEAKEEVRKKSENDLAPPFPALKMKVVGQHPEAVKDSWSKVSKEMGTSVFQLHGTEFYQDPGRSLEADYPVQNAALLTP